MVIEERTRRVEGVRIKSSYNTDLPLFYHEGIGEQCKLQNLQENLITAEHLHPISFHLTGMLAELFSDRGSQFG